MRRLVGVLQDLEPGIRNGHRQPPAQSHEPGRAIADETQGRAGERTQLGGEPESIVQVANLIYAGTKSSKCFSDHFLAKACRNRQIVDASGVGL